MGHNPVKHQVKDNYTGTPDVYFDSIMRTLTDGEWKVLSAIIRKTIGFGKLTDKIAMSQMLNMTGYTQRKSVLRVRKSLADKGLISYDQSQGGNTDNCTVYTIVLPKGVSWVPVVEKTRVSKTPDTGVLNDLTRVSQTTPTIDNSYNKHLTTNIERADDNPLSMTPQGIPKRIAEQFEAYRKAVRDCGPIGRFMLNISGALSMVGEQILHDALAQVVHEAGRPGFNKTQHSPGMAKLLASEHNMRDRAAKYAPPVNLPEWMIDGDTERIISTVARILKNNGTVPKEAESWIPQAQQRLTKHLVA